MKTVIPRITELRAMLEDLHISGAVREEGRQKLAAARVAGESLQAEAEAAATQAPAAAPAVDAEAMARLVAAVETQTLLVDHLADEVQALAGKLAPVTATGE